MILAWVLISFKFSYRDFTRFFTKAFICKRAYFSKKMACSLPSLIVCLLACSLIHMSPTPGPSIFRTPAYSFLRIKCRSRELNTSPACARYFARLDEITNTTDSTTSARPSVPTEQILSSSPVTVVLKSSTPTWLTAVLSILSVLVSLYGITVSYIKYKMKYSIGRSLRLGFDCGGPFNFRPVARDAPIALAKRTSDTI